ANITLTATIEKNGVSETKTFEVTVLETPQTDAEAVAADTAALDFADFTFGTGDSETSVTQNIGLPTSGSSGTTITWVATYTSGGADASGVIASDGTVIKPAFGAGDANITLTATIEKNGVSETKTFEVTVLETPQTDAEAVAADTAALDFADFTFGGSDTATSVTQNIGLPVAGSSGTTITWTAAYTSGGADASGVIASNGTVTRPAFGSGDTNITLTATIEKNGVHETKTFEVTVLETPPTDAEAVAADTAALDFADFIFGAGDSEISVTQDIGLPSTGSNGTTITWVATYTSGGADASGVIASDGIVTRPAFGSGDANITLTATIEKNGVFEIKTFEVTVLEGNQVTYTAGLSFNMRYVPGGLTTPTGTDDSGTATVSNAYLMAETEVTYELWYAVYTWATHIDRGANKYTFANAGQEGFGGTTGGVPVSTEPVNVINWRDAMVFSNALTEYYNAQNGTSLEMVYYSDGDASYATPHRNSSDATCGTSVNTTAGACDNPDIKTAAKGFRLPTSDEWELAARYKGSDSANGAIEKPVSSGNWWTPGNYASGATATNATARGLVAWYSDNSSNDTHNVATKTPNALGLFDMSGNVSEWVFDWHPSFVGSYRVYRGGSFSHLTEYLAVGFVDFGSPYFEHSAIGFRLACNP
ncbi:MAG: formylglycine-generating enzyme family protein, partial [Spirochaetia bacterium]|nr:formylglycine-generating enzyme family protein [Spirochaetia bacterium]